jgi:hypothetical protein
MGSFHTDAGLPQDRLPIFYYLTGVLTCVLLAGVVVAALGVRYGFQNLLERIVGRERPAVDLPRDLIVELSAIGGVVDNADNPTQQRPHDTILVAPDAELGYVLRPNTRLRVSTLKTPRPFNFDPPLLHLPEGAAVSASLDRYITENSRLTHSYSTDRDGRRVTLPPVQSSRRILVIGDSVPFGVGVSDEDTIASALQRRLGNVIQVVNAGVGGYSGRDSVKMAARLAQEGPFEAFIYVACQNDFMIAENWNEEATVVLKELTALAQRFGTRVVVLLHVYSEYTMFDVYGEGGWPVSAIELTTALRAHVARLAGELGFSYYDWAEAAQSYLRAQKSVLAGFALYADHCHLSPLGNEIAAQLLQGSL